MLVLGRVTFWTQQMEVWFRWFFLANSMIFRWTSLGWVGGPWSLVEVCSRAHMFLVFIWTPPSPLPSLFFCLYIRLLQDTTGPGTQHTVQVYMGDNMHQFKDKLAAACKAPILGDFTILPRWYPWFFLTKNDKENHLGREGRSANRLRRRDWKGEIRYHIVDSTDWSVSLVHSNMIFNVQMQIYIYMYVYLYLYLYIYICIFV